MYAIVSAIIGATFGFAFSNSTKFYVSFLIAFFISFFVLTFLHTLIKGVNWMFIIGCKVFLVLAPIFFLWFIYFLPGFVFFFLAIVCGFITAPIWYFISIVRAETTKVTVLSVVIALLTALVAVGVCLLISPILVYRLISYGWIIAALIITVILSIIVSIVLKATYMIESSTFKGVFFTALACIPLIIIALVSSKSRTYEIYTASDMKAFGNAPTGYETVFILQNDIDFEGENVSWYGKQDEFEGVFEGGGYTLSNIHYVGAPMEVGDKYCFGLVGINSGIIKNLNFENCSFEVDFYYEGSMQDGSFGIIAGVNGTRAKIYNCTLTDCYAKYYRYSYVSGSSWYRETITQDVDAGYIVGAYYGGEKSNFDPSANYVVTKGIWKPDDEFFTEEENWKFVKNKYGTSLE